MKKYPDRCEARLRNQMSMIRPAWQSSVLTQMSGVRFGKKRHSAARLNNIVHVDNRWISVQCFVFFGCLVFCPGDSSSSTSYSSKSSSGSSSALIFLHQLWYDYMAVVVVVLKINLGICSCSMSCRPNAHLPTSKLHFFSTYVYGYKTWKVEFSLSNLL